MESPGLLNAHTQHHPHPRLERWEPYPLGTLFPLLRFPGPLTRQPPLPLRKTHTQGCPLPAPTQALESVLPLQRADELLGPVAAAYRHYDNPAGARFKVGRVRPAMPDPQVLHPKGPQLFGGRSVLGVREVACLWHAPGSGDETPLVEQSEARPSIPPPGR